MLTIWFFADLGLFVFYAFYASINKVSIYKKVKLLVINGWEYSGSGNWKVFNWNLIENCQCWKLWAKSPITIFFLSLHCIGMLTKLIEKHCIICTTLLLQKSFQNAHGHHTSSCSTAALWFIKSIPEVFPYLCWWFSASDSLLLWRLCLWWVIGC